MMPAPKSLTATVHVRFHYDEAGSKPPREGEIALLNKLMDQAAELTPELQELLAQFVDYVNRLSAEKGDGQSPG